MQLATINREVTTHGLKQVHRASLAASAKIFEMFENDYSDKFKAIVRELVANGIDAHREAGNTDPVKVFLPDDLDPYFRVKDTGLGMSHDFVTGPFLQYGNGSTKSHSDEAIGGWGRGSKSPYAYTDQFTLTSIHDGTKSTYAMFKDETGFPCAATLDQQPTDEPNSVEFTVPVDPVDFDRFRTAAQTHLPYFGDEVKLFGADLDPVSYMLSGKGWGIRASDKAFGADNSIRIVLGGMTYPVNVSNFDFDDAYDDALQPLYRMPIDLVLDISACSVAPNRESLIYDDKTKKAIPAALRSIIGEITRDMPTMFDHIDSKWDAVKALAEYIGEGSSYSPHNQLVLKHVLWKGDKLETSIEPTQTGWSAMWVIAPRGERIGRRNRFTSENCPNPKWSDTSYRVSPGKIACIIIDDLESKDAPIKRIKTYVDVELERNDQVLVIRSQDVPRALAGFGNPSEFILASDLPAPAKRSRSAAAKAERAKVRMFRVNSYRLGYGQTRVTPRSWQSPVDEIAYANQPESGILLVCDNFEIPSGFRVAMKTGLIDYDDVHLVNKSDAPKLGDEWRLWSDVFQERLEAKLAEYPTAPQWKALMQSPLQSLLRFFSNNRELGDTIAKSKPLKRVVYLIEEFGSDHPSNLSDHIEAELPPRLKPDELLARIERDHPHFLTLKSELRPSRIDPDHNTALFNLYKDNI